MVDPIGGKFGQRQAYWKLSHDEAYKGARLMEEGCSQTEVALSDPIAVAA